MPPEPSAYQPCTGWRPSPAAFGHGLVQFSTRTRTWPNALYATIAPTTRSTTVPTMYAARRVVM